MTDSGPTLSDDVLAAFLRAYHEGDLQVAEHLLRALEVMECRDMNNKNLQQAYLSLAHLCCSKPRH